MPYYAENSDLEVTSSTVLTLGMILFADDEKIIFILLKFSLLNLSIRFKYYTDIKLTLV